MESHDERGRTAVDVVERWYQALVADDLPGVIELSAPDVRIRYPGDGRLGYAGVWRGHDGLVGWAEAHDEAEEIVAFRIDAMVGTRDVVVVLGSFEGRARDTGRSWRTDFAHALTVRDGRVANMQSHFDTATAVEAHQAVRRT